jgi:hypothetical protein
MFAPLFLQHSPKTRSHAPITRHALAHPSHATLSRQPTQEKCSATPCAPATAAATSGRRSRWVQQACFHASSVVHRTHAYVCLYVCTPACVHALACVCVCALPGACSSRGKAATLHAANRFVPPSFLPPKTWLMLGNTTFPGGRARIASCALVPDGSTRRRAEAWRTAARGAAPRRGGPQPCE